jgi:glutathione-specific gamma-glutamylcyclotransferase
MEDISNTHSLNNKTVTHTLLGQRDPQFIEGAQPLIPYHSFVPKQGNIWIFAYGSLVWKPGFPVKRRSLARIHGFHRALCMRSTLYRGTVESPGLVLGLKPGGSCLGAVFEVARADIETTFEYLWHREMRGNIYNPRMITAQMFAPENPTQALKAWHEGRAVQDESLSALTFIANCQSPAYTPELCPVEVKTRVAHCKGENGTNLEYVRNTVEHLEALGIHDRALRRLLDEAIISYK